MKIVLLSIPFIQSTFYWQEGPPLELTIILLCFCGLFLLLIGVVILGFIVRKEVGKDNSDTQDKL